MSQSNIRRGFLEGIIWVAVFSWLLWGALGCTAIHTPIPCWYDGDSFWGPCQADQKGQIKYEYLQTQWRRA